MPIKIEAAEAVLITGVGPAAAERESVRMAIPRHSAFATLAQGSLLVLSDIGALLLAALSAYFLWPYLVLGQALTLYMRLVPLLGLFPLIYAAQGLYRGFGLAAAEVIRRLVLGTSLAFLALAATSFVLKVPPEHSRMGFVLAWLLSLGLLPTMRFFVLTRARRISWWGEPTVVIGDRKQIKLTLDLLKDSKSLSYRVVGLLCADPADTASIAEVPVFGGPEAIAAVAAAGIRTVMVWVSLGRNGTSRRAALDRAFRIDQLQKQFRHVVVLLRNDGLPVEHVEVRNLGTTYGVEFSNELLRAENRLFKRLLDIMLGSIFLLLSAPLILTCGLLVQLMSRGPMFFVQEREGLNGDRIKIWKLRTMHADAERRLKEHLELDTELRREWETKCKLARDPRVVRGIGTFLRRFSIDELPQLWSVVRGTMSLVGPRPLPGYHLSLFPIEFIEFRRSVRPGITGLWQVTVRSNGGGDEHQQCDSYYIRNWSVWLDLYILAKTVVVVVRGSGAF